jgi:hypothetical protein
MTFELDKEYRISKSKQIIFRVSATILAIGAIVSIPTSIILRSVIPFLGGIELAYLAHVLFVMASHTMLINSEGILLKSRSGEYNLSWLDIGEITLGKGINRHKVSYTLLSNPPSPGINLGLCRFKLSEDYHLPSTFGMRAKDLAVDLERTRNEKIQHLH